MDFCPICPNSCVLSRIMLTHGMNMIGADDILRIHHSFQADGMGVIV